MSMAFHQKRFFAFRNGAPSIHSLRTHPSKGSVLVTTDRYVQQLSFDAAAQQYQWEDIPFSDDPSGSVDVIASGVIACPGRERIVVAYAEVSGDAHEDGSTDNGTHTDGGDKLFLSVVDARTLSVTGSGPPPTKRKPTLTKTHSTDGSGLIHHDESKYSIRFELVAAPTVIMSVRAKVASVEFNGVILFRMESMVAIGFLDDVVKSATPSEACVRLSNDQFAAFFPEFAQFHHPVLTVDTLEIPAEERGWIAMGCADGFIRVFAGSLHDNILSGPYETREVHVDGPVMSVSLFTDVRDGRRVCNLVAACAIGHAIVYEDLFGQSPKESVHKEQLAGSDQFDTIFSARAVDIDLDGSTELLIGTDNQSLLAYKRRAPDVDEPWGSAKQWALLSPDQWHMRAFGGVYSLAWLDLNGDGVRELVAASSTGVYVYEAAPQLVLRRLQTLLDAAMPPPAP